MFFRLDSGRDLTVELGQRLLALAGLVFSPVLIVLLQSLG